MGGTEEDGGEIRGRGVHFPSAPVKHLADLRNTVNSQRYSSIYEDRRPKIEDIERSDRINRRTKMAAEVETLRLLAQPELIENRTARNSDTK